MMLWLLLVGLVVAWMVSMARSPSNHKQDANGDIMLLDLHKPRLPWPFQLANLVLGPCYRNKKITSSELLEEASRRTGLKDWGDEGQYPFREGLDVFLQEFNANSSTTPIGKMSTKNILIRLLSGRLKIMDLVKRNPQILDEVLLDPVFIVGPPRSGTTHLHCALAQGNLFRSLKFYEVVYPVIDPEAEKAIIQGQKDPRQDLLEKDIDLLLWLRPFVRHIHEMDADGPEEEVHLMAMTCQSVLFITLVPCPQYLCWESQFDRNPGYAFLELCLKMIQWQDAKLGLPRKPFLLKCPSHVSSLPELRATFPSAKIIQLHRSPKQILPSVAHLLTYMYGINCNEIDLELVGRMCHCSIESSLKNYVSAQHIHDGNVFNVIFEQYEKDNAGWIRRVRQFLGVEHSTEMSARMDVFLRERARYKRGRLHYSPSLFGFNMKDIRMKFSFYAEFQKQLMSLKTMS